MDAEVGVRPRKVYRRHSIISPQTFYRCKGQVGNVNGSELKQLRLIQTENRRPAQGVENLSLDNQALKAVLTE